MFVSYSLYLVFFIPPPTTEIYTLSLHDALPILKWSFDAPANPPCRSSRRLGFRRREIAPGPCQDRKSTRLNSSHRCISYAVFCLKKKKNRKRRKWNSVEVK